MLNCYEMSDLIQFVRKMEDCKEKELFNTLLFEYNQYTKCGTVQDCQERKEWLSFSIEEIRIRFNQLAKFAKEEIEAVRLEQSIKPKKRGRPPKRSDNNAE